MKSVKALQAKRKKDLKQNEKKVLRSTMDQNVSPPKFDHIRRVKHQIEQSTETIKDLRMRIDQNKGRSMASQHESVEQIRKF